MSKRAAEQWYTGDWYRAVDVQKCGPATRGIWRDAIDAMTNEQITGKIRGTREEIARLLRCNDKELQGFLDDNKEHRFADVTIRNGKVTIICRRLYRAYCEREATKARVRKFRQRPTRKCNGDVTPLTSTSSSTSLLKTLTVKKEFLLKKLKKDHRVCYRWFLSKLETRNKRDRGALEKYAKICTVLIEHDNEFNYWLTETLNDIVKKQVGYPGSNKMFIKAINNKIQKMTIGV